MGTARLAVRFMRLRAYVCVRTFAILIASVASLWAAGPLDQKTGLAAPDDRPRIRLQVRAFETPPRTSYKCFHGTLRPFGSKDVVGAIGKEHAAQLIQEFKSAKGATFEGEGTLELLSQATSTLSLDGGVRPPQNAISLTLTASATVDFKGVYLDVKCASTKQGAPGDVRVRSATVEACIPDTSTLVFLAPDKIAGDDVSELLVFVSATIVPAAEPAGGSMQARAARIKIPHLKLDGAEVEEAVAAIDKLASQHDPASPPLHVTFVPPKNGSTSLLGLELRDVPLAEVMRIISELSGYRLHPTRTGIELGPDRSPLSTDMLELLPTDADIRKKTAAMVDRAKGIILPEVEFENASLPEIVDFLRTEARKIVSQGDSSPTVEALYAAEVSVFDATISLHLNQVSYYDALTKAVSAAGKNLVTTDSAFIVCDRQEGVRAP